MTEAEIEGRWGGVSFFIAIVQHPFGVVGVGARVEPGGGRVISFVFTFSASDIAAMRRTRPTLGWSAGCSGVKGNEGRVPGAGTPRITI